MSDFFPHPGDKLFITGEDWRFNACLGFARDKWDLYATGYKEAADVIVDHITDTGIGTDLIVYPVAFLYRQYLELRIKELIINGRELLDATEDLEHVHELDVLWKSCRPLLEQVWPGDSQPELNTVQKCIAEFCTLDRRSMSFRYPINKQGKPSLEGISHINLPNLKNVIGRIASLLDGASLGIADHLATKASMREDFMSGMQEGP